VAGNNLHPAREFHAIAAILCFFAASEEARNPGLLLGEISAMNQ